MALRKKFPERPNNGSSYRMSVGFELRDGQRKQAQFTLGTNRRVAQQKYNALNDWWKTSSRSRRTASNPKRCGRRNWSPRRSPRSRRSMTYHFEEAFKVSDDDKLAMMRVAEEKKQHERAKPIFALDGLLLLRKRVLSLGLVAGCQGAGQCQLYYFARETRSEALTLWRTVSAVFGYHALPASRANGLEVPE
jgi:hypothetical protein